MTSQAQCPAESGRKKKRLRIGFSTGTAAVAAARAALRTLLTGSAPEVVAVRLPAGYFLPVRVEGVLSEGDGARASVVKDGGDDPDVTHKAEIQVVTTARKQTCEGSPGILIVGGLGVGSVTKAGLPVGIGEPAVNPVPREMLRDNLAEELLSNGGAGANTVKGAGPAKPCGPHVFVPFDRKSGLPNGILLEVEIRAPKGAEIARHTLNPRLGIVGGISILGTTGLVRPFSHEAYEDTIRVSMSVAASAGQRVIVLSTGGKSERLAREMLPGFSDDSFVQVADFFAFSVEEAARMGFEGIVHSVFFGKAVKMAQGHPYTHAHKVPMDLELIVGLARELGYGADLCDTLREANTARHALEMLSARGASDVICETARRAAEQSRRIAGGSLSVRLLLFDYDGTLLADVEG